MFIYLQILYELDITFVFNNTTIFLYNIPEISYGGYLKYETFIQILKDNYDPKSPNSNFLVRHFSNDLKNYNSNIANDILIKNTELKKYQISGQNLTYNIRIKCKQINIIYD